MLALIRVNIDNIILPLESSYLLTDINDLLGKHLSNIEEVTSVFNAKMQTTFLVLAICLAGTQAFSIPSIKWGRCPKVPVQQNFNIASYMSDWYPQKTYNVEAFQGKGSCTSATYSIDSATGLVDVYNKQISASTNKWTSINGTAAPVNPEANEGKFEVQFQVKILGHFERTVRGPYWVLGTDYNSYTVVYACENFLFIHIESIWLMSRERELAGDAQSQFDNNTQAVLEAVDLASTKLETVDQSSCDA